MAKQYGIVPKPAMVINHIPVFDGQAAGYYGQRLNNGVVWHRVVGTYRGTIQHFNLPGTGLTDYIIGNEDMDGAALDGTIVQLNDPLGTRSGWASGRVIAPYGDGLAFVNDRCRISPMGINAVNGEQISIELSGYYTTRLTPKQTASLIALTAYYADQAKIPWDVFPIWPGHEYSFVRWHQEFTGPQEKICPGGVVMDATSSLLAQVAEYMRKYQEPVAPPVETPLYLPLRPPAWLTADLAAGLIKDHEWNGQLWRAAVRERTALRQTPRRQTANEASDNFTGPAVKQGEVVKILAQSESGVWGIDTFGNRLRLNAFDPDVIIRARAA